MSSNNLLALTVFLGISAGVAGCNTVEGVGRDVEGAGEAVQDASQDVAEEIDEEKDDD
jgi:predicted small secreted protein